MTQYRLTYYGLSGFDYKGFNTLNDLYEWVNESTKYGTITPKDIMKYNKKKDEYEVIGYYTKA